MVNAENLQKYSLFGGLMAEQIQSIIPLMKEEKYKTGDLIITEGNTSDKIYFLIEGQVSVLKKDMELSRFGEGEAFGEMEVLDVMPAIASIKALSDVSVLSMSNKALREIYKMDVKVFALMLMNLARDLCRRLRKSDEMITTNVLL
jgi:CRP/FNR family transcriptional regulator, cyclic AMP receptor protein